MAIISYLAGQFLIRAIKQFPQKYKSSLPTGLAQTNQDRPRSVTDIGLKSEIKRRSRRARWMYLMFLVFLVCNSVFLFTYARYSDDLLTNSGEAHLGGPSL